MWQTLKSTTRPIVLYGMGDGAQKIIDELKTVEKTPTAVFASDEFVRGQSFCGMKVLKYAQAKALYPDMIVLVSFGTQLKPVLQNIRRIASECTLYAPDVAVIGGGIFNKDYYNQNKTDIDFVCSRLADTTSKMVFDNILNYKLTGDVTYLFACETDVDEAYKNILKLNNNETYIDLGAYRGDTVCEFLNYTNGYNKIYAVEPDIKNFKKLCDAYGDDAQCINAAAYDSVGKIAFNTRGGRNSAIGKGTALIDTVSVDSILKGERATYIKMDVEGCEYQALMGAKDTIKTYAPKLSVAAYHRFDDIIKIPLQVLNLNPDYKVYLRHFPYVPAWDTNYYFVR